MSRLASITRSQGSDFSLDVQIDASGVIAVLGYFPAAAVKVFHVRTIDLLSHHRRAVAVHHKFPSGRRAQKMIFARTSAKYATQRNPTKIEQLVGRSFSRPAKEEPFPDDIMAFWDNPQDVNAGEDFIIPLGYGLRTGGITGNAGFTRGAKISKVFEEIFRAGGKYADRELHFIKTKNGRVLAVLETVQEEQTKRRRKGVSVQQEGSSFQVLGVVARRRRQGAMIDFYGQFDRIVPKHLDKFDKGLGMALTAAGRAKLDKSIERELGLGGRRGTFRAELKRELRSNFFRNAGGIFDHTARAVAASAGRDAQTLSERGAAA